MKSVGVTTFELLCELKFNSINEIGTRTAMDLISIRPNCLNLFNYLEILLKLLNLNLFELNLFV